MINNAHVSRECVSRYAFSVRESSEHFIKVGQDISQVDDAIQEMSGYVRDLEVQNRNCSDAISHLDSTIIDLEAQLAALQTQLAVTPPEIPVTYEDEEGHSYTVMEPNPAYYALLDQICGVQNRLNAAKATRDATVDMQSRLRDSIQRFNDASARLMVLRESISHNVFVTVPICQDALDQLQKIEEAIGEYQSVMIGAFYDHTYGAAMSTASFPSSAISTTVGFGGMDQSTISERLIGEQGRQVPGFRGTCGPCTMANICRLLGTDCDEAGAIEMALSKGLCVSRSGDPEDQGGMSIKKFMQLGNSYSLSAEKKRNPSMSRIKEDLEQGKAVSMTVSSELLRNPNSRIDCRHRYTDHFVTVTGVNLDSNGNPVSINVRDTGQHARGPNTTIDIVTFEKMKRLKDFTIISFRKR